MSLFNIVVIFSLKYLVEFWNESKSGSFNCGKVYNVELNF